VLDVTESDKLSPAERYARFRREQPHPVLADFRRLYDFALDDFQVRACEAVEEGGGVLVAAPTGSGKTLVGEFAVHLALQQGRKAFYTTPIKALSNQKYADLVRRYGQENVGLLTGDNSVNGEAPVVVMTTEVLRNMLYAGSRTLSDLGFVVMDEVHYLADRSRGAVWEEVIIHLPESVAVISLSATVSNAEEFGEWLATVRGSTTTIVEETRPVPLYQHVMVGRRMYDLFDGDSTDGDHGPDAKVNPELVRVARDDWAHRRVRDHRTPKGRGKTPRPAGGGRPGRAMMPSRFDVVDRLDRDALLPAIYFIFSRVGCDAAVTQCLNANLRLTTPQERDEIFRFVEERCADLPQEDLAVLGYHDFLDGLTRGVAAHHAGMLPRFKECVEELFAAGRCRVVFATETLALGINMPARSVVIEKLVKWNGETHADITPGEYTQLTGRAGRRGIDVEGHGVVLWSPGLEPRTVAGLASTRTYPLRSSFRPSYNMAVNLVHQYGRTTARELLESSFAQFQADKAVVGLARQLRKAEEGLGGYAEAATCHLGDFMEYAALRRRLSDVEAEAARSRRRDRRDEVVDSLDALRPGDVIQVPTGKFSGWAVVVDPGQRSDREEPRPYVLTIDRHAQRLAMRDFDRPVRAADRMRVPKSFNGRNPQSRRDLASALKERVKGLDPGSPNQRRKRAADPTRGATEEQITRIRAELRSHPCHGCEERESHARWAERHHKLERETSALRRRIESRTNTIARQFDRVCDVLTSLGYLTVDGEVTESGRVLMRVYTELDLVVAESLRSGLWDGLSAPDLAAALSVLVHESRRADDQTSPRPPQGPVREVLGEMVRLWGRLSQTEKDHRVEFLREPDIGFAWAAQRWAAGGTLDEVLTETDMAAGDFVRRMKQLLDQAGPVSDPPPTAELRTTARETIAALRRGVVAYSSLSE
jgi:ATP-dependent RNA helicase HelY